MNIEKLFAKRSGDENIGKLIVFTVTIIIAISLVALIAYFYNVNRDNTALTTVAFSTTTNITDISKVVTMPTPANGVISTLVTYSALDGVYTATFTDSITTTDDSVAAVNAFAAKIANVAKNISTVTTSPVGTSYITYKVK